MDNHTLQAVECIVVPNIGHQNSTGSLLGAERGVDGWEASEWSPECCPEYGVMEQYGVDDSSDERVHLPQVSDRLLRIPREECSFRTREKIRTLFYARCYSSGVLLGGFRNGSLPDSNSVQPDTVALFGSPKEASHN